MSGLEMSVKVARNTSSGSSPDLHYEINLEVGQMLLFQSAKLPHARMIPLEAEWYANAFVHLAPVGWAEQREVLNLT
jgi:hypothetical protein